MRREPEVPEERVPVVECFDGPARITLEETCNNSFCENWHPPECLFYKTKSGCRFGEKCSYAHRKVDEQPSKRSKKNDNKSAVAMLKKNDWHENVWQLVVNRDERSREIGTTAISTVGCVFQDMKPPRSVSYGKAQTYGNRSNVCKSRKLFARHTKIRDQNPTLQNLRIGLRRRQSGKSKVPAKQRGSWPKSVFFKPKGARKSNILLTFGK